LDTQSGLLSVLILAAIVSIATTAYAIWKLLNTIEKLAKRVDDSLQQFEMTAEEVRKTNAVFHDIMSRFEKGVANVEHVTEGVRKFRRTLDAASGVLDFAVLPILGTVAGVLAGSKAGVSHVVNRIFRKEGRHGK
jgi:ABC-type transporter Mla subunit MlaD